MSGSPVTVTGTTAPGNAVYVTATNTDANSATTSASTTADAAGAFSLSVAVTGGTTVLNVVAVSASGGTAHVKRTVVFDFVPGTLLLDVDGSEQRRQRARQLRLPDLWRLPRRRVRHPAVPGLRRRDERRSSG